MCGGETVIRIVQNVTFQVIRRDALMSLLPQSSSWGQRCATVKAGAVCGLPHSK